MTDRGPFGQHSTVLVLTWGRMSCSLSVWDVFLTALRILSREWKASLWAPPTPQWHWIISIELIHTETWCVIGWLKDNWSILKNTQQSNVSEHPTGIILRDIWGGCFSLTLMQRGSDCWCAPAFQVMLAPSAAPVEGRLAPQRLQTHSETSLQEKYSCQESSRQNLIFYPICCRFYHVLGCSTLKFII